MLADSMGSVRLARLACLAGAASMVGACRVHSTRDAQITAECMRVAEDTGILAEEAGMPRPNALIVCADCCKTNGTSNLDAESCACGERGIDVLWN